MPGLLSRTGRKLARLTRDFPRFLRTPLGYFEACELMGRRLSERESNLRRLVERGIYARPSSPYAQLLREVGCELGDFRKLLAADGPEGTLATLAARGVYLTFDEFKGRRAVVRGSRTYHFQEWEFDNPFIFPHVEAWSGGTRGPQTSVKMTMPYFSDLAANTALALEAHKLWDAEHVVWLQGFTPGFIYAGLGRRVTAWFHPTAPFPSRLKLPSWYIALLGWISGHPLPFPRYLSVREPERLVEWLVQRRRRHPEICVTTYASSAVRVCLQARARGVDLGGVSFITLGEPFTPAKLQALEAVGARALVRYAFTEAGIIGYACGTPRESDDLHFQADSYGLIRRPRQVGEGGPTVEALLYSSLLPTAPKLLLNVESGDFARVEQRACGCAQGAVGLETHIWGIRSFEKLSSEGMTFVQTDLLRVLEEVLPERFGGTSADYQVVEREGAHGILQLALIASPALGELDENQVRAVFLAELGGPLGDNSFGASVWRQLGSVVVERGWPMPTAAGKILPFHLAAQSPTPGSTRLPA